MLKRLIMVSILLTPGGAAAQTGLQAATLTQQAASGTYGVGWNVTALRTDLAVKPRDGYFADIASQPTYGFAVGFVGYWEPTERVQFRLTPRTVFDQLTIKYREYSGLTFEALTIKRVSPEVPLDVLMQLARRWPVRLVAGLAPGWILHSKDSKDNPNDKLQSAPFTLTPRVGLAYPIRFREFSMWPELVYAYNVRSAFRDTGTSYSQALASATVARLTLTVHFQGTVTN